MIRAILGLWIWLGGALGMYTALDKNRENCVALHGTTYCTVIIFAASGMWPMIMTGTFVEGHTEYVRAGEKNLIMWKP